MRCTDKEQSKETEDRAVISAIKHIIKLVYEAYSYSLAKPSEVSLFSFESLALQDCNHKASDDEPAMGPCYDIEA